MSAQSNIFSNAWWDGFVRETKNLSCPVVFKNMLAPDRINSYRDAVASIISRVAELRSTQYGFRVYLDGHQINGAEMEAIYDDPPLSGESLLAWVHRVFSEKSFGIIINSGEKFSSDFSKDIATIMAPLFERIGFPRDGIQFSIFVGNYDKTPLGIHQDYRGENVLHFHVGPGDKTMHVWDKDEYRKLTTEGGLRKGDFHALEPYAQSYQIQPGDLFFMPEGTFHVGSQKDLSVAITVWQYTHTNERFIQELLNHVHKQIKLSGKDAIEHDARPPHDGSHIDDILPISDLPDEYKDLTLHALVKKAYLDWRLEISSNAGYRNSPFKNKCREIFSTQDIVQIENPYRILTRRIDGMEKLMVYVRGHKFEIKHHDCLLDLIAVLNDGQEHKVDTLLKLLNPQWSEKVGLHFLSELHVHQGIVKVADSSQPIHQNELSGSEA